MIIYFTITKYDYILTCCINILKVFKFFQYEKDLNYIKQSEIAYSGIKT